MRVLFSIIILLLPASIRAQTEQIVNQYDQDGNPHGAWYVETPARMGESATVTTGSYEHGKKLGLWYIADSRGDLMAQETYKNDLLDGDVRYYESGKLICAGRYRSNSSKRHSDTIVVVNPVTMEEQYKVITHAQGTLRHGTWRYYDPSSGQLLREEEYQMDELIFKKDYAPANRLEEIERRLKARRLPHTLNKRYQPPNDKQHHYLEVLQSD